MRFKIKELLKKNKLISKINVKFKSFYIKSRYKKIIKYYKSMKNKYNLSQLLDTNGINDEWFSKYSDRRLNVLFIGTNFNQDNGGFVQALSKKTNLKIYTTSKGEWGILKSFKSQKENTNRLVEILESIEFDDDKIDLILMQSWGFVFDIKRLIKIKDDFNLKIINIGMDERLVYKMKTPFFKINYGISGLNKAIDLCLTTCPEVVFWYLKENVPAVYFPLASSLDFYFPMDIKKKYDVGFIGRKYGYREDVINFLKNNGINVKVYGEGWEMGEIKLDDNNKFYNECRIMLGIATIGYSTDFFNPKLRDFEVPMSGGFYITNKTEDLNLIFKENINIVFYSNLKELVAKIKYYLENENQRIEISKNAYSFVSEFHTYENRFDKLFNNLSNTLLKEDLFVENDE